ncbi:hypothetical protein VP01_551g3 [Puccinia sorghi]|uniref:Uncharacterized protein n=1 Tax=Puccinia sorghi TaxID=27349 RepID=A0A0L6UK19_9BASI|nr:hypothetical protein VP01_551g3 [Puccinia sorghi]
MCSNTPNQNDFPGILHRYTCLQVGSLCLTGAVTPPHIHNPLFTRRVVLSRAHIVINRLCFLSFPAPYEIYFVFILKIIMVLSTIPCPYSLLKGSHLPLRFLTRRSTYRCDWRGVFPSRSPSASLDQKYQNVHRMTVPIVSQGISCLIGRALFSDPSASQLGSYVSTALCTLEQIFTTDPKGQGDEYIRQAFIAFLAAPQTTESLQLTSLPPSAHPLQETRPTPDYIHQQPRILHTALSSSQAQRVRKMSFKKFSVSAVLVALSVATLSFGAPAPTHLTSASHDSSLASSTPAAVSLSSTQHDSRSISLARREEDSAHSSAECDCHSPRRFQKGKTAQSNSGKQAEQQTPNQLTMDTVSFLLKIHIYIYINNEFTGRRTDKPSIIRKRELVLFCGGCILLVRPGATLISCFCSRNRVPLSRETSRLIRTTRKPSTNTYTCLEIRNPARIPRTRLKWPKVGQSNPDDNLPNGQAPNKQHADNVSSPLPMGGQPYSRNRVPLSREASKQRRLSHRPRKPRFVLLFRRKFPPAPSCNSLIYTCFEMILHLCEKEIGSSLLALSMASLPLSPYLLCCLYSLPLSLNVSSFSLFIAFFFLVYGLERSACYFLLRI